VSENSGELEAEIKRLKAENEELRRVISGLAQEVADMPSLAWMPPALEGTPLPSESGTTLVSGSSRLAF
jgi:hypothetical protein